MAERVITMRGEDLELLIEAGRRVLRALADTGDPDDRDAAVALSEAVHRATTALTDSRRV